MAAGASGSYTAGVVARVSMTHHLAVVDCASAYDCSSLAENNVDTIVLQPCIVPDLRNRTLPSARRRLKKHNCTLGRVKKRHGPRRKRGRVIAQKPAPGTKLPNNGRVSLVFAKS